VLVRYCRPTQLKFPGATLNSGPLNSSAAATLDRLSPVRFPSRQPLDPMHDRRHRRRVPLPPRCCLLIALSRAHPAQRPKAHHQDQSVFSARSPPPSSIPTRSRVSIRQRRQRPSDQGIRPSRI
jgi:hypothetical protein